MIPDLEAYKNPEKINLIFHLVELFQVVGVEEFHKKNYIQEEPVPSLVSKNS